ncbi:MbnP family protein [uncultured Flavobacterium sp.]|uniref:MbnP family protein n=1 Tax=uncultured Flavobacterium sp. TaxID=165435 RepID=UPI0025D1FE81|nr:MbnP family protein [uncultured Flavobacterium sp.]
MKFKLESIAALAAAATLFVSCSNDDSTPVNPDAFGGVEIYFDNGVAGDALTLGTSYVNSNGESLTINRLNYVVSNFVLIKADGTEYAYPKNESYFIISQEAGKFTANLENVPEGDYKKVRFGIGVDQQRYLQGETAQQSFWDLATAHDLTWTWSTGYRFINFEGTFTAPGLSPDLIFQVHQGSNTSTDNYREVTLDLPTTARVRQGEIPSIHVKTNANVILDGQQKIKLAENLNQAGTGASVMGGQNLITIASNTLNMFTVDHVHNGGSGHHD